MGWGVYLDWYVLPLDCVPVSDLPVFKILDPPLHVTAPLISQSSAEIQLRGHARVTAARITQQHAKI